MIVLQAIICTQSDYACKVLHWHERAYKLSTNLVTIAIKQRSGPTDLRDGHARLQALGEDIHCLVLEVVEAGNAAHRQGLDAAVLLH